MSKFRESSTDKAPPAGGLPEPDQKRKWVNLAQLDGPLDDALVDRLAYKPALRFHGLTGGLWGQGISGAPSILSERPPSYNAVDPLTPRDAYSTSDQGSVFNSIPAISRLKLRRRNTLAVVVVAIGLLAAVAAISGLVLHFLHPKEMLRANVRFTIANRNFSENMSNHSSVDFNNIQRPLCHEMDRYFLTSELADHYLGCRVITIRDDESISGIAVHQVLDFHDNDVTHDGGRIKDIILRKSGRMKTNDTLYLVIGDFNVYLRSLKVDLETLPYPEVPRKSRPRIPWDGEVDFIDRLMKSTHFEDIEGMKQILQHLVGSMSDMTAKIDTMQNAIDFMNKTFHATHQPLYRFEETLENMTLSMGNLNNNLREINRTLAQFKRFLKQFDNTVFSIDDVILHIDESLTNLGQAANFVEYSLYDLNETSSSVNGDMIDDVALKYVHKSVLDVDYTSRYSNETLESMQETLRSLENAVLKLNSRVDSVIGDSDILRVSLRNINQTVVNTHNKLLSLYNQLEHFNDSIGNISKTAKKLNETYTNINKTLHQMNEPYMLVDGTVLEVIHQLSQIDNNIFNLSDSLMGLKVNMSGMNETLLDSMKWINGMVSTLKKFDLHFQNDRDGITVSLKNKDILETIGMLLEMNGTLSNIGEDVDEINDELDRASLKLDMFGQKLSALDRTLDNIDVAFQMVTSTVEAVNATVQDTANSLNSLNDTTFTLRDKLNNTDIAFGHVNDTLNTVGSIVTSVNETLSAIRDDLKTVNNTLADLSDTKVSVQQSSKKLFESLDTVQGSTMEINQQLHNANETLRVIQSKADIVGESFNIINGTLKRINDTVFDMEFQLNKTEKLMTQTNYTLEAANVTLEVVNDTYGRMNSSLHQLTKSFNHMTEEFKEVGKAFPNMMSSIAKAQSQLTKLQEEFELTGNALMNGTLTRRYLNTRFSDVMSLVKDVKTKVGSTKSILQQLQERSEEAGKAIMNLKEHVNITTEKYNFVNDNVVYINATHDKLLNKYKQLSDNKTETSIRSIQLASNISDVTQEIKDALATLDKYQNLNTTLPSLNEGYVVLIDELNNKNITFNKSAKDFNDVNDLLWNTNGHPTGIYTDIRVLKNKTKLVNDTMLDFESALDDLTLYSSLAERMNANITNLLDSTTFIQDKIDVIETTENDVNKNISFTDRHINATRKNISNLVQQLYRELNKIDTLKNSYGDVNGTFDEPSVYENLKKTIQDLIKELRNKSSALETNDLYFQDSVNTYKHVNDTHHDTIYNVDDETKKSLINTLSSMKDTAFVVNNIQTNIDGIVSDTDRVKNSFTDIVNKVTDLQDSLQYHKDKNNFIDVNKPQLKDKFSGIIEDMNSSISKHKYLIDEIHRLRQLAESLQNGINLHENVNMSVQPELTLLFKTEKDLENMINEIGKLKTESQDLLLELLNIDEENVTLDQIKEIYRQYNKALTVHETALADANTLTLRSEEILEGVGNEFIDMSEKLYQISNASESLAITRKRTPPLSDKLSNASHELNDAIENIQWLKDEFNKIKQNYTNFTATDIDLTDSYINGALKEHENLLASLKDQLENNSILFDRNGKKLNTLDKTFNTTNLDRTNVYNVIVQDLHPKLTLVNEQFTNIDRRFEEILKRLEKMDLTLKGVNETIHITNKQLFIDRQKKLLADTVFPDLIEDTNTANRSLQNVEDMLDESRHMLEYVMDVYNKLRDRMHDFPNINISLDEIGQTLAAYNNSLNIISDELDEDNTLLDEIWNQMWINQSERYSDKESIQDIKNRYDKLHAMLHELIDDIHNSEGELEKAHNGSMRMNHQIIYLKDTLDDFEKTKNQLNRLLESLLLLESEHRIVDSEVNKTLLKTNSLEQRFNKTQEIYNHLNKTVLNNTLSPFNISFLKTHDNVDDLLVDVTKLKKDIKLSQIAMNIFSKSTDDVIGGREQVETIIKTGEDIIRDITSKKNNITVALNITSEKNHDLYEEVKGLVNDLNDINTVFIRQEKEEYFEKHFPENHYLKVGREIKAVIERQNKLKGTFNRVNKSFNRMANELTEHDNLEFDIVPIDIAIKDVETSIFQNEDETNDIFQQYKYLESSLLTPDGNTVSDEESIDDMKTRYQNTISKLKELEKRLREMVHDSIKRNKTLTSNSNDVDLIDNVLDQYTDLQHEIGSRLSIMAKLNESINDEINVNNQRNRSYLAFEENIADLEELFPLTSSSTIDIFKTNISKSLTALNGNITNLAKTSTDANERIIKSISDFNGYQRNISKTYTDPYSLQETMGLFHSMRRTFHGTVQDVSNAIDILHDTGANVNKMLNNTQDDIEMLEHVLKEKEKEDYIIGNTQVLWDKYYEHYKLVFDMNKTFSDATNELKSLDSLLKTVKNIMKDDYSINIVSLADVDTTFLDLTLDMNKTSDVLQSAREKLRMIDLNIIFGGFFTENDTIADIKNTFDWVNKTLDTVKKLYDSSSSQLHETRNNANDARKEPQVVIRESEKLSTLRELENKTISVFKDIPLKARNLKYANMNISHSVKQLNDTLHRIQSQFSHVKNETLQSKLDSTLIEFGKLKTNSSELASTIDGINKDLSDLTSSIINSSRHINSTSFTVNGLQQRVLSINGSLSLASEMIQRLHPQMDITTVTAEEALLNTDLLTEITRKLEQDFVRQEKEEYFENNFPENQYLEVGREIHSIIERQNKLKGTLNRVNESFNTMTDELAEYKNLNFDIESIGMSNKDLKTSMIQNEAEANEIDQQYKELKSSLLAPDGYKLSDEENIDDMKTRYQDTISKLKHLEKRLRKLKSDSIKQDDTLSSNANDVDFIKHVVDQYKALKNDVSFRMSSMTEFSDKIDDELIANYHRNKSLIALKEKKADLQEGFPITSSSVIDDLKTNVSESLKDLHGNIFYLTKTSTDANERIDKSIYDLSYFQNNISETYTDPYSLKDTMELFPPMRKQLHRTVLDVAGAIDILHDTKTNVDKMFNKTQDEIKMLEHELKEKEKEEYISDNIPNLREMFLALHKLNLDTNKTFADASDGLKNLDSVLKTVNDIMKEDVTINIISIADVKATFLDLQQDINQTSDVFRSAREKKRMIDPNIFSPYGQFFSENDTIADIKSTFEWVNKTLTTVLKLFNSSSTAFKEIKELAKKAGKLPLVIIKQVDKLVSLRARENETRNVYEQVPPKTTYLNDTNMNILDKVLQLNKTLNMMQSNFSHVKDKTLHSMLEALLVELDVQEANASKLNSSVSDIKKDYNDLNTYMNTSTRYINSTSFTLNDLEQRVSSTNDSLLAASEILQRLHPQMDITTVKANKTLIDTDNLMIQTLSLERNFVRQEKDELFRESFPGNLYSTIEGNLQKVLSTNDIQSDQLRLINSSFRNLNDRLENYHNIFLDDELSHIDNQIDNISDVNHEIFKKLKDLISVHESYKKFLSATDGGFISDNETITAMKMRYQNVRSAMKTLKKDLDEIEDTLRESKDKLQGTNSTMIDIDNTLDRFDLVKTITDSLKEKADTNKLFVNNSLGMFDDMNATFTELERKVDKLFSRFTNTSNIGIGRLRDAAVELRNGMRQNITFLHSVLNNADDLAAGTDELISNYSAFVYGEHKHTNDIKSKLQKFKSVNESVSKDLVQSNSYKPTIEDSQTNLNADIDKFRETIDKLRRMLIDQEKYDYYDKYYPGVSYTDIGKELRDVESLNTEHSDNMQLLTKETGTMLEIVENSTHIDINLDDLLEFIHAMENTSLTVTKALNDSNDNYFNTSLLMKAPDGELVSENETIHAMKDRYNMASANIREINDTLTKQKPLLQDSIERAASYDLYLKKIQNESNLHDRLRNNVRVMENKLANISTNSYNTDIGLTSTNLSLQNLKDRMKSIRDLFHDVNDSGLHNDAKNIAKQLEELENTQNELETYLYPLFNNTMQQKFEYETLKDISEINVTSLKSLALKNKLMDEKMFSIDEQLTDINAQVTSKNDNLAKQKDTLEEMNDTVENLKERFRRQQIYEYIKENFPQVLQEYEHLNYSIDLLKKHIPLLTKSYKELNRTMKSVLSKIHKSPYVFIDVDNVENNVQLHHEKLDKTISNIDNLMKKVEEMEDSLSSNVRSNETLNDIKARFQSYGGIIDGLADDISRTDKSLEPLAMFSNITNKEMRKYKDALDKYAELIVKMKETNITKDETAENLDTLNSGYKKTSDLLTYLSENVTWMHERFKHLNNSYLLSQIKDLGDNLQNKSSELKSIEAYLKGLNNTFNSSSNDFEQVKSILTEDIFNKYKLDMVNNRAAYMLDDVSNKLSNMTATMTIDINPGLNNVNDRLKNFSSDIDILMDALLEQEKKKYLRENRPPLTSKRDDVKGQLDITKMFLYEIQDNQEILVEKVEKLNDQMQAFQNIQIPLTEIYDNISSLYKGISENENVLNKAFKTLENINKSEPFTQNNWTRYSIDSMKETFMNTAKEISELMKNTSNFNTSLTNTNAIIHSERTDAGHIQGLVDKFVDMKNSSVIRGLDLDSLDTKLKDTGALLTGVYEKFQSSKERLFNLTTAYQGVTNDDITSYTKGTRSILEDILSIQIPLARKLFNKSLLENYNFVTDRFEDVLLTLNDTYDDKDTFKSALEEVDDSLLNITLETEMMLDSDNFYRKNAFDLIDNLNRSDGLLNKLEAVLKQQKKRDLLQSSVPNLQTLWKILQKQINLLSDDNASLNTTLSKLVPFLKNINEKVGKMKSVNISTNALGDDLHNVSQTIKHVSLKLLSSNNTLQNLPLFDINIESVSTNDSYSIQSVVELVNDINDTLITVQKDLNMTDGILSQSQSTSDDVQKELDDLDMIVSRFKKVERNLYELENVQNILTENSTSLFDLLLISKASVDANKKNLDTLNTIYKDFDFNSSKTENLIDRANVKVGALLALLKVTEDELNKTNDDLDGMQYRLFEFNDNKEILNKTLAEIKQGIIGKRQSHEHVNTTLHDILGDIPTLQITLANISSLVDEMNTSLINEKDKSLLKDKQLPKLLERYQQIDLTIDMTNKTLQKMANEIQDLKKHVDELKLRMDTYSTINISSTDIQKQIKHLEDQLAIMNGHYGNTEEVINKLRDTIDKHNVLGKNISTENVQEQYDDFNKTMNMVGEVLKKIEYESYVMEDHFNSLNDTIQKTNSALDDFSDQVQSSNIIKESIDGIGGQIQLNKDQVQNMKEVIDNMTDSYNDMQQNYENVLDTVATNNTIVRKLIKTAGENVGNIATILNSLEQQYNESVEHFFKMNGTLFDNVSEYFDLKRILNQVQLMEDKLQETITSLEKGIAGTSKESSQLTDSLSDLDSLVNSLNDTLHFEQLKYDFLRNNFKTLDSKLKGLLSPITDAKSKISGVSENVQNVLKFVHNVSDMINKIPNINIPLSDFLKSIDVYTTNVNNASAKTNDIEREYKDLRLKSLDLTDSTKNITEIRHIYSEINTTLDTLQEELETVKDSMNGTNTNATSIEQQMKLLNSSLDEFNELDRKIVNISADFNNSRQNIKTLKDHIAVLDTSADELQQSLQNMKALYDIVDDVSLQKELLDLIEQIKNNSDYIQNIRTGFNNVSDILIGAETVFKDTNAKLHGSIDKFDTLNSVINHTSGAFNSTSRVIVDIDEITSGLFLGVDGIDTTLKRIRTKMSELNKTMEEEKKKREFIKEMFPKIKSKFHLISEQLNNTSKGLTQVDGFVRKSENTFGDVKGRIDMLDSIQIPLNDEKDAIETMQSSVNKSKSEINHVTDILHALDLDQLADTTVSFDKLERLYEKFRNETREAGKRLQVVNDSTEIVSRTNSRVADVLVDVNNTLDNFVKMETILDSTFDTSSQLSQQIGKTNRSINNMNDELVEIDSLLKGILSQFSHIQDPKLLATKEDLQNIMVSQRGQLDSLLTSIGGINAENAGIVSDISLMNDSISSTKLLLKELKEHIQTVNSTSSSVMNTINKTDEAHMALNSTASQMPPEMKRLMDNIVALQKKYKKEQEKLDFIAKNKPILQGDFTDLKPLFDDVNTNLSHTDISLSNLKQKIQRVDERLNTFKPLEITTATEMKLWDTMDNRKKQFHETFTLLTTKYKTIAEKINQLDDRNGTIDDIKKTFKSLNESLKAIEKHLQELEQNFTNIHLEESKVDETLNNLKETMNSFAKLQESSSNAGGRLETLKSTMDSTSAGLQSTNAGLNKVNSTLDKMKSNYAVLKNKTWEGKLPQFKTKLNADKGEVKKTQDQLNTLSGKVNTTEDEFQNVYRGLTKATYTRENVTKSIENMSKTLSGVDSNLALLPKELNSIKADNDNQKKKVVEFQQDINNLDEKLKDELQKFQFVNQHLDPTKEKHSKTNVNFFANKPNMEEMGAKLDELFRIINKIKNKLIDFGLTDTDSSVKAWDVKIIKLNNTVNSIIDNNKLSEEKLNELKRILWDTKPLYRTEEPLAELEKRFEGYNKTLDAIAAAAHTIKIKLNDLGNEAERVIGELVERDMVLTTTPATTTPSGPPDWLTVKSSGTGTIGRDSGFVRCTVGDMTQWEMMKITRLQPDGREVPIAAWKQGFGARKAVRDRRVVVRKTTDAVGGSLDVQIKSLQCEDEGTYHCTIDTYSMWPVEAQINVITPPEDSLRPEFPTEVFEDKVANFSCTGKPGYPGGRIVWKLKHLKDKDFKPFDFYSARSKVEDRDCIRTETNTVEYPFDMSWNDTKVRCYIEGTDYFGEGVVRLLPYDICNKVRYQGTISHPYTPHKYIVCGKALNIMECPGNTCYDHTEENCVTCKGGAGRGGDPCQGQSLFSYVAHETDCKKFYICMGPNKSVKKCAKGYFAPNVPGNCVMTYAKSSCGLKRG